MTFSLRFSSHVIAFDGFTFRQLWNQTFAGAESYASLSLGYHDEDDVPDVMVKYQYGEGYPVYSHEVRDHSSTKRQGMV